MIINLRVDIRRNTDNMVATTILYYWDYNEQWWKEGNGACDCNRGLFFIEAMGVPLENCPCGTGRYSVRLSDADTKVIFYDELDQKGN